MSSKDLTTDLPTGAFVFLVACFFYFFFFFFFFLVSVWSKRIAHFRFGVKMKITTLSLAAANLINDKYAIICAQFVV